MSGRISVYAPFDCDPVRLRQMVEIVRSEAGELGLDLVGPFGRDDNRICVFYEDSEAKCYVYVDNYEKPLNMEKAALTIRVMVAMTRMRKQAIRVSA